MSRNSRAALALAVVEVLRDPVPDGAGLDRNVCDYMIDGRPAPNCGDLFVAVHDSPRVDLQGDQENYVHDSMGVYVTVTARTSYVPFDATGRFSYARKNGGILDVVDRLRAVINAKRWDVVAKANAHLGAGKQPFTKCVKAVSDDAPQPVGSDWFHGEPSDQTAGARVTIRVQGAERLQDPDCMDGYDG